jgi:hypothetical protein
MSIPFQTYSLKKEQLEVTFQIYVAEAIVSFFDKDGVAVSRESYGLDRARKEWRVLKTQGYKRVL